MKTALDLPDGLVREVKIHAVRQGKKLKDAMAELLRVGLDASTVPAAAAAIIEDPLTGLPVVMCPHAARVGDEITPERVAEVLLQQETAWAYDASRQ